MQYHVMYCLLINKNEKKSYSPQFSFQSQCVVRLKFKDPFIFKIGSVTCKIQNSLNILHQQGLLQVTRCCHKKLGLKSFFLLFSICSPNSKGLWYVRKIVRLEEIYLHNQENSRGLIKGKATLVWLSELRQAGSILSLLMHNFGLSFMNEQQLGYNQCPELNPAAIRLSF